jgi:phosphoserine aminotransferase
MSRPVDVSKFGIIYTGAQKNMAPAGLTVVIIREDLAGHELPYTPIMMNYKTMIDKDSMYNTPPCWCIYMLGLMLDWVDEQGGVAGIEKVKAAIAAEDLKNDLLMQKAQDLVVTSAKAKKKTTRKKKTDEAEEPKAE